MPRMLLKAGLLSLALLVASRLLGLARDSSMAAAFGASGAADVVVLMLSAPDWIAGVVAAGALSYVLLPAWAGLDPAQTARLQRLVFRALLVLGALVSAVLVVLQDGVLAVALPGLPAAQAPLARLGLGFCVAVVPLALVSALWVTRLQHESDAAGMYGANLVVNGVLVVTLAALAWVGATGGLQAVGVAGMALVGAMLLRLLWLWLRLPAAVPPQMGSTGATGQPVAPPGAGVWLMAAAAAALPLTLPFAARSLASGSGEGALALFGYAWKLVELPLGLAIQLVATLAFPGIARAVAAHRHGADTADPAVPIGTALTLAWALAWAALVAVVVAAPALAQLLFGWGRMGAADVQRIAQWGAVGAWCLPAMALIAVLSTVLASLSRLVWVVLPHAVAVLAMLLLARLGRLDAAQWMVALAGLHAMVAVLMLPGLGAQWRWVPWRALALTGLVSAAVLGLALAGRQAAHALPAWGALALAALGAAAVLGLCTLASPQLRRVWGRRVQGRTSM